MGRLQGSGDPLGNTSQYEYDLSGRVTRVNLPGGATRDRTYDAVGNLVEIACSDATTITYTYDSLNRLAGANGLALTRDGEGRVTDTDNPGRRFSAQYGPAFLAAIRDYLSHPRSKVPPGDMKANRRA